MPNLDFNGDGRSDVLWLLGGNIAVSNWLGTPSGGFTINDANAGTVLNAMHTFQFEVTGDFNGDGRTDVVWAVDPQNGTGDRTIWLTNPAGGFSVTGPQVFFAVGDPSWHIIGAGDFNGDGIDDLLWRNDDGTLSNWLGSAAGTFTINDANAMARVPLNWHVVGIGDFDGDGRDDLLWQADDGTISNWLGTANGGYFINDENALNGWPTGEVLGVGDFNGDGLDDVLMRGFNNELYAAATAPGGAFYYWAALGFVGNIPAGWSIVGTGDYNGDGIDDILWRNANGAFSNWLGTGDLYRYAVNDGNAYANVPVNWQVADTPIL